MFSFKNFASACLTILLYLCVARSCAASERCDQYTRTGDYPVATCTPAAAAAQSGSCSSYATHLTGAALSIYNQIETVQSARDTAEIEKLDRLVLAAEDHVCCAGVGQTVRFPQLLKLLAWLQDRLVWGGSLFGAGAFLAWLGRKGVSDGSRMAGAVSMVCFGCSYALLLPLIAAAVIIVSIFWGLRQLTAGIVRTLLKANVSASVCPERCIDRSINIDEVQDRLYVANSLLANYPNSLGGTAAAVGQEPLCMRK
jgi:hypothetical protein